MPVKESADTLVGVLEDETKRILDHFLDESLDDLEIRASWDEFAAVDAYLFPLEYLADLHEKDRIEIVRVSPVDARRGFGRQREGTEKIAGDTFHHFGGFFKRSWRSNDILWGRLDALDLMFDCLLTPKRVRDTVRATDGKNRLKRYLAGSDDPADFDASACVAEIFPHSPLAVKARIATWLAALVATDPRSTTDPADAAIAELEPGGAMAEILVRAAQLEAVEADLPDVIQDAVDESVEWGTTKRSSRGGRDDGFERLDVDALVGGVIKEVASQVIRPRAPTPPPGATPASGLTTFLRKLGLAAPERRRLIDDPGKFFDDGYRVGGEDFLRNIPPLILVQTFAHALIVMKNAMFAALGDDRIPHSGAARRVLRWALEYPLWLAYAFATVIRRQPGLGALHFGVALAAATVFVAGFYWRDAIWWAPNGSVHKPRVVIFAVAPLMVLAAQFTWLRWTLLARSSVDRVFRVVRVVGLAVAAGVVFWGIQHGEYGRLLGAVHTVVDGARAFLTSRTFYLFVALPAAFFLLCWRFRLPSRWSRPD